MAINWSLFKPVDIGAAWDRGWDRAQKMREEHELKSALAAFSENPSDPKAQSALARASPQFAMEMGRASLKEQADIREQQRRAAMFADDPGTGVPSGIGGGKTNWREKQRRAIIGGDPQMAASFGSLADDQERTEGKRNDIFARVATQLQNLPDEASRRAALQQAAPALIQYGWTAEELAAIDLSDTGLGARVAMATTPMQQQNQAEVKVLYNPVTGVKEYYDYLGNFVGDQARPFKRYGGKVYRWDADVPEPSAPVAAPSSAPPDAMTPSGDPLNPNLAQEPPPFDVFGPLPPNALPGENMESYLTRKAREDIAKDPANAAWYEAQLAEMVRAYRAGRQ